jgi:hypothetical protein
MINLTELAPELRLDPRGYWVGPGHDSLSYPEHGNDAYFQIEDESFWFQHRNRVIAEAVRSFPPTGPIFDVGGGNGCVAYALQKAGFPTVVVEPGSGAANAYLRGIEYVVMATTEDAGFRPGSLPAAGLFDVVEHIQDDVGFLVRLRRLMQPGARLYVTVPAFHFLWSAEDTIAGHYRRYTLRSLRQTLKKAGFVVEYATYFFWILPLPILFLRTLPTLLGMTRSLSVDNLRKEHVQRQGMSQTIVNALLKRELRQIRLKKLIPIGTSCLAVARPIS